MSAAKCTFRSLHPAPVSLMPFPQVTDRFSLFVPSFRSEVVAAQRLVAGYRDLPCVVTCARAGSAFPEVFAAQRYQKLEKRGVAVTCAGNHRAPPSVGMTLHEPIRVLRDNHRGSLSSDPRLPRSRFIPCHSSESTDVSNEEID